jgi:hypothetical protein
MAQKKPSGPPMDLDNMRHNGIRGLLVSCRSCRVDCVLNMDAYDGSLTVPSFGPRMVCQACGTKGADVRPNWGEQPLRLPPLR